MDSIINKKAEKAYRLAYDFDIRHGECSQATFYALQNIYNMKNSDMFKGIGAFAGGGAHRCDGTCGVYAAAIFFMGLFIGRSLEDLDSNPDDPSALKKRDSLFNLTDKIYEKFVQNYGSVICNDIQRKMYGRSYYLRDRDEIKKFIDIGGYTEKGGPGLVGNGAKWTVEIIEDFLKKR
ncbi:MAG: C-GCAxxG-C-C family protein [Candidatus Humimicrobiaceae bacterium]